MIFINGVNNVTEIMKFPEWVRIISVIILLIILVAFIWCSSKYQSVSKERTVKKADVVFFVSVVLFFSVMSELALDYMDLQIATGEYEVSVSDETDMNKFVDTYEIVSYSDGKYTIKMK